MNIDSMYLIKDCKHEVWVELRRDERAECYACGILHLADAPIEELEATLCENCNEANMAEYACRDEIKSNRPICVDCCHCSEHDQCDPCTYWVEVK
jgi:hypothetical protein